MTQYIWGSYYNIQATMHYTLAVLRHTAHILNDHACWEIDKTPKAYSQNTGKKERASAHLPRHKGSAMNEWMKETDENNSSSDIN